MVICPLCEHQQAFGFECDQCGKDLTALAGLGGLGPPPAQIVPIDGLDQTVAERVGPVPTERVGDLEVTQFADVAVAVEAVSDLDTGRASQVGEVPVEPMIDLTLDRAVDDGVRTALPTGALRCRYCGHSQASGAACERCGQRLPAASTEAAPAQRRATGQVEKVRCRSCGAPAVAGGRCGDCGREVPAGE